MLKITRGRSAKLIVATLGAAACVAVPLTAVAGSQSHQICSGNFGSLQRLDDMGRFTYYTFWANDPHLPTHVQSHPWDSFGADRKSRWEHAAVAAVRTACQ